MITTHWDLLAVAATHFCVFESLFVQAHIQAGHYTDCIWEVSLSLVTSLTTLFVSCVLRFHGLLSLATSQQKISRNCGQLLTGDGGFLH
jgi:cadmium resistance protein CadD (predicted permease)